jgi:hypothetical protein
LFFLFSSCQQVHKGTFENAVELVTDSVIELLNTNENIYYVFDGTDSRNLRKSKVLNVNRQISSLFGPDGDDKYPTSAVAREAIKRFNSHVTDDNQHIIYAPREADAHIFTVGEDLGEEFICLSIDSDVPMIAGMRAQLYEKTSNSHIIAVRPTVNTFIDNISIIEMTSSRH